MRVEIHKAAETVGPVIELGPVNERVPDDLEQLARLYRSCFPSVPRENILSELHALNCFYLVLKDAAGAIQMALGVRHDCGLVLLAEPRSGNPKQLAERFDHLLQGVGARLNQSDFDSYSVAIPSALASLGRYLERAGNASARMVEIRSVTTGPGGKLCRRN